MADKPPPRNKNDTASISTNISSHLADVVWTHHHEKILIDWADKATCYKWLHEQSQAEFARKSRWFTIPVIIMSTLTGTANFAQDRIPPEYLNMATMVIGGVNLIAGVITTISQFLKINEMNESHRVSAMSWGKFQRNLQVELSKPPLERTHALHLIKVAKEEYDRLIETSNVIPKHIVLRFKEKFSGGEITYDSNFKPINITVQQQIYMELSKPAICDVIESVKRHVYAETQEDIDKLEMLNKNSNLIWNKQFDLDALNSENAKTKEDIIEFNKSFYIEYGRYPTLLEIKNNFSEIDNELIKETAFSINTTHV